MSERAEKEIEQPLSELSYTPLPQLSLHIGSLTFVDTPSWAHVIGRRGAHVFRQLARKTKGYKPGPCLA